VLEKKVVMMEVEFGLMCFQVEDGAANQGMLAPIES
jgi:hypothetical protein